ncbi:MAG TPA: topoisomerase DNA-binding C4 zinc finger domain-containing protein [Symbiobacteriaceae bacterium]|nr:topoisomerase DNA-binding C4 zinc finger domain-containing protein [Symbiobacteriaceae bacterium]
MGWEGYALIGVLVALGLAAPVIAQVARDSRLHKAGLDKLDQMTLEDMIVHMGRLCGALGYRVFRPVQQDCGFDLILVDGLGQRRGVVVRHYKKLVDDLVLAEVGEAAHELDLAAPMLVSVQGYTYKAREAATKSGAILWSLAELTAAIGRVKQSAIAYPDLPSISTLTWQTQGQNAAAARAGRQPEPEEHPHERTMEVKPRKRPQRHRKGEGWSDDPVIPKCPRCGRKMVVRRGAEGDYWGCPIFPRCLGTRPR